MERKYTPLLTNIDMHSVSYDGIMSSSTTHICFIHVHRTICRMLYLENCMMKLSLALANSWGESLHIILQENVI